MIYKIFLFLCFFLPFQVALNPTEGIDLASIRVFILLLFFLCLTEGLKKRKLELPHNIQTGLLVSFLFLIAFSAFVAQNSSWSLRKLIFLFSIFPIYFVSVYLISDTKKITLAIKSLVWGGFLAAILGLVQFFSQFIFGLKGIYKFWASYMMIPFLGESFSHAVLQNSSWLVNISGKTYLRATATFPDPHMFSFFLGILSALSFSLVLTERKKVFYIITTLVLLVCNLLTFSRGGYLGIVAGLVFILIFFWGKINVKIKMLFIAGCIAMGILCIIPNPISERYLSIFNLKEGSNKERIEIWQKTLKIIENKPILGVGIGNYPLQIKPTAEYREPYYAHNTYLDIAVETGIINAIIWLSFLIFSGWTFFKKAKQNLLFLGPAVGIIVFATHSLVETAIYSPVVLTLFLILISFGSFKLNESAKN